MDYGQCLSAEHLLYSAVLQTEPKQNFWGVNKVHK